MKDQANNVSKIRIQPETDKSGFRPARTQPGLKSLAGLQKAGWAHLSGALRRFLHTHRVFQYPVGMEKPAGRNWRSTA